MLQLDADKQHAERAKRDAENALDPMLCRVYTDGNGNIYQELVNDSDRLYSIAGNYDVSARVEQINQAIVARECGAYSVRYYSEGPNLMRTLAHDGVNIVTMLDSFDGSNRAAIKAEQLNELHKMDRQDWTVAQDIDLVEAVINSVSSIVLVRKGVTEVYCQNASLDLANKRIARINWRINAVRNFMQSSAAPYKSSPEMYQTWGGW